MNIEMKLDNTYLTISTTHRRELHIDMNTNIDDVKLILESIYEVLNMEDFIATLDQDQIQEIVNYSKEIQDAT